jgi:multidrug efflux pump subunit AcrB
VVGVAWGVSRLPAGFLPVDDQGFLTVDIQTPPEASFNRTLAVVKTVGECFVRLYFLERACQAQVMALSAGDNINNPPQGSPDITAQQGQAGVALAANMLAWPALKRKAYRLDPDFAS